MSGGPSSDLIPARSDLIRHLLDGIRAELERSDTDHPLFHGAWDWHSSVHGHWALLALDGGERGRAHAPWVVDRLRSDAWRREVAYLVEHPNFELPYGRAWLLLLLRTYEERTGDRGLRATVGPVVESLHRWCVETDLGPDTPEYQNPCWPWLHLWRWPGLAPGQRSSLHKAIESRCQDPIPALEHDREPPGGFFSRWSLFAHLLGNTLGHDRLSRWLDTQRVEPESIEPINSFASAHQLGTNASRAWGAWTIFQTTGDPAWRAFYERHVSASLELHSSWKRDRHAYGHWVPQFTLYAIQIATEDSVRPSTVETQ